MNNPQPFPPPAARQYYEDRWRQLNGLVIAHSEGALTYLLTTNGGAVAGMLAFIGAVPEVRKMPLSLWALGVFAAGLIAAGLSRAYTLEAMKRIQVGWMADYQKYSEGQITWNELIARDNNRVKNWQPVGSILGYGSFVLFLGGVVVATFIFNSLPIQ